MTAQVFKVVTGNDPEGALTAALLERLKPGDLATSFVYHDDNCPCDGGRLPMRHCTCEFVRVEFEKYGSK